MPTIAEIRQQSGGAYDDMNDQQLGDAIHKKFYSDMPRAEFNQKIGLPPPEDVTAGMALRGVPVLGAYVPQAEAAIRAAAGQGEGATFGERYRNILPQREAQYAQAESDRPILSGALQAAGGAAALAPIGATATGAKALGMSGPLASRMLYGAGSGAAINAADAVARGEDVANSVKFGAAAGAAAPVIAGAVGRAISPIANIDPERLKAVAALRSRGVEPTAGQISNNRPLQWAEQHLGEMSGLNPTGAIEEQITKVPMRAVGSTATRATQEHVDDAFRQVGNEFDRLATSHELPNSAQLGKDIMDIIGGYADVVAQPNRAPIVGKYAEEIANHFRANPSGMPGDIYQSLRSRLEKAARETTDEPIQSALRGYKMALDNAMERHLAATGSPDLGAWQKVRNQYRNLLVLEDAANRSSTTAAQAGREPGQISPAALYQAVQKVGGKRGMARGAGDYEQFARAASDVTRGLPSSGTPQRWLAMAVPAALGAAAYGSTGEEGNHVGNTLAGLAAPILAGRAINSRLGQAYLKNQLLGPTGRRALQGAAEGGLLSLLPQQ